jgi:hypothetical protein
MGISLSTPQKKVGQQLGVWEWFRAGDWSHLAAGGGGMARMQLQLTGERGKAGPDRGWVRVCGFDGRKKHEGARGGPGMLRFHLG